MLRSDETKAGGKPRKAKGDGDKARKRKAAVRVPEADQPPIASAQTETEAPAAPIEIAALSPTFTDASPIAAAAEQSAPVTYRAFADAWGNYSRTSLEQTKAYFEKLAGVHSLGAAFEVQAEFAKQACETFVAQSQKIGELQGELARQRLKRFEGLWRR